MTVNGGSTLLLLLEGDNLSEALDQSAVAMSSETISMILCIMILIAGFTTALALGLLIKIAKTEKALPGLRNVLEGRQSERGRVMGVPLIVGMTICMIFVILELVLQHMKV
jgi:hypothetical protein